MKIASMKKEKPSIANPSPNTLPNVAVKFGHSRPISKLRIVPVMTPTANSATMIRVQRRADVPETAAPLRGEGHPPKRRIAGEGGPKQKRGGGAADGSAR